MIAPSLDIVGGQAVQADRLLKQFRKEPSVQVDLLPINPHAPGPFRQLQDIKYVRTATTSLLYGAGLIRRIAAYDIVHIFTPAYFPFLLAPAPAILLSRALGKKTILNYRDGQAEDHLKNWRSAVPLIRLVDQVVAPSGFLVDVFGRFGLPARSIFNIIDTRAFRFRERPRPRPVFLHNRGMEPLYNIPCTLRAFALIQQRFPDASLTLAHDGPLRESLEAMVRDLELRNVRFIGFVSQERTPVVYDEADIYLTSPNIDNMPGSLLECYAAGVPVVATAAGGIPYILEHDKTGLLAPINDHVELARQAMRLIDEEGLAARITSAARRECEKYSWEEVGRQWVELYHSLAGRTQVSSGQSS